MVTKEELIEFETDIGESFNKGVIRSPIHLYSDNEDQMMDIFKYIHSEDWICCTWRNHYQCLLKGMSPKILKEKILKGKSMIMSDSENRIICSSIVGGIPSIATGLALGIQMKGETNKVYCFVGDMSAATGAWNEAYRYSMAQDLPIVFIIEDNGKSVETPTHSVWGSQHPCFSYSQQNKQYIKDFPNKIIYYQYTNLKYPHSGAGKRIQF
jgi:TPP-dependent pyruvate/acetoin dehydrogenase alpha subunit